jgi:hypothetical protein
METTTRSTHRSSTRRFFIGASDVQGADEGTSDHDACCVQHWADPHNQPRKLNRHWYAAITGGMPLRGYIVAVCYWTIVILLGSYPWNILLMLLSLPAMDFPRRDQTVRCWGGCPLDTGHHDER